MYMFTSVNTKLVSFLFTLWPINISPSADDIFPIKKTEKTIVCVLTLLQGPIPEHSQFRLVPNVNDKAIQHVVIYQSI
jgi:hypothetical protein